MPDKGTRRSLTAVLARVLGSAAALGLVSIVLRATPMGTEVASDAMRCEIDPPREVKALKACLSRSPRDIELLLELGGAYEARGELAAAVEVYRRAVIQDPRDAGVRVRLGMALRSVGDLEGARRAGTVAVALRPGDPLAETLATLADRSGSRQ